MESITNSNIFDSLFTLNFQNKGIQKLYDIKMLNDKFELNSIIKSFSINIILILISIILIFNENLKNELKEKLIIMYLLIAFSFVFSLLLIIVRLFHVIVNRRLLKLFLNFYNTLLLLMLCFTFKYIIFIINNYNSEFFAEHLSSIILSLFDYLILNNNRKYYLVLMDYLIFSIINEGLNYNSSLYVTSNQYGVVYSIIFIVYSISVYYLELNEKSAYYDKINYKNTNRLLSGLNASYLRIFLTKNQNDDYYHNIPKHRDDEEINSSNFNLLTMINAPIELIYKNDKQEPKIKKISNLSPSSLFVKSQISNPNKLCQSNEESQIRKTNTYHFSRKRSTKEIINCQQGDDRNNKEENNCNDNSNILSINYSPNNKLSEIEVFNTLTNSSLKLNKNLENIIKKKFLEDNGNITQQQINNELLDLLIYYKDNFKELSVIGEREFICFNYKKNNRKKNKKTGSTLKKQNTNRETIDVSNSKLVNSNQNTLKKLNLNLTNLNLYSKNFIILASVQKHDCYFESTQYYSIDFVLKEKSQISQEVNFKEEINNVDKKEDNNFQKQMEFVSKIAHEFKTPLFNMNAIIEDIYLLIKKLNKSYKALIASNQDNEQYQTSNGIKKATNILISANNNHNKNLKEVKNISNKVYNGFKDLKNLSEYIISLTHDFKFIAQKEAKMKVGFNNNKFNLNDMIMFVYKMFEVKIRKENNEKMNFQFILDYDRNVCPKYLYSDERRIKQILLNLLSNSQKFTKNGSITLKIDKEAPTEQDESPCVKFSVIDTGKGIEQEVLEKISRPWNKYDKSSSNKDGSGLGLNIVYELAEGIASDFKIESELGKGTIVHFSIPYCYEREYEIEFSNDDKDKNSSESELLSSESNLMSKSNQDDDKYNIQLSLNNTMQTKSTEVINYSDINIPICILTDKEKQLLNVSLNLTSRQINNKPNSSFYNKSGLKSQTDNPSILLKKDRQEKLNSNNSIGRDFSKSKLDHSRDDDRFNILVVDDNSTITKQTEKLLSDRFKKLNKKVYIKKCADGVECLYQLYIGQFKNIVYDAVITDSSMKFMSGDLLIKNLTELKQKDIIGNSVFISIVSGFDNIVLKEADKIYEKPFDKAKCIDFVNILVSKKGGNK